MNKIAILSKSYLEHCRYAKNLSEHSIRAYAQDLRDFSVYLRLTNLTLLVSSNDIEQYARYLSESKSLKARSIKRKIASLSIFFNWLEDNQEVEINPVTKARITLRYPKSLPKVISRQELGKIAQSHQFQDDNHSDQGLSINKDYTTFIAVLLMSCTGIRVGELVSIKLIDIDLINAKIKIHGKGSRERYVYVTNQQLLIFFQRYFQARMQFGNNPENLLLNSRGKPLTEQAIRLRLKKLSIDALGKKVTPHVLRHTAATLLIEQDVDIRFVQKLLGHQSIATTEIYTHVSDQSLIRVLNNANHLEGVL